MGESDAIAQASKRLVSLPDRTFQFGVRIVRFCRWMNQNAGFSRRLIEQLLASGTSIGANVEEGQAAQTRKDFITKYSIAPKEARESCYWLRLVRDAELASVKQLESLLQEAQEITRILAKSVMTARERLKEAQKTAEKHA